MINPASIASQLSLNAKGSQRTQDFTPNLLNCFRNQSKVKKNKREYIVFKGDFRPKIRAV